MQRKKEKKGIEYSPLKRNEKVLEFSLFVQKKKKKKLFHIESTPSFMKRKNTSNIQCDLKWAATEKTHCNQKLIIAC